MRQLSLADGRELVRVLRWAVITAAMLVKQHRLRGLRNMDSTRTFKHLRIGGLKVEKEIPAETMGCARLTALLTNILLVFGSTCVALAICGVLLRVFVPQDLSGTWFVYTKDGLLANKSSGDALHQMGARRVKYHFASPHLRDLDSDLPAVKEPSRGVLVVGDSYTFGWLLPDRDTYVRRLEDYANQTKGASSRPFKFLDAAVGGWGAADYTVYLRDYLSGVHPEYVLVIVNADDIGRALNSPLVSFDGRLNFHKGPQHRIKALTDWLPFCNYLA
jgi:hypothetical protein